MVNTSTSIVTSEVCESEMEALESRDGKRVFKIILKKFLKEQWDNDIAWLKDFETKKDFLDNITNSFIKITQWDKTISEADLKVFKKLFLTNYVGYQENAYSRLWFSEFYEDFIEKDLKFNWVSLHQAEKLKELLSFSNIQRQLENLTIRLEVDALLEMEESDGKK